MKQVVNMIIVRRNRLLVAKIREGDWWTLPGGAVEKEESKEEALRREIGEELPNATIIELVPYKEFQGITPHGQVEMTVSTFLGDIKGSINPGAELTGTKWASPVSLQKLNLTATTKSIIKSLRKDGYL